ncbi:MAG: 3-isopropylmalate dehydratase [Phycisphaerales bacterium]|jgi:3-isopropylmalate/(R)-2-methylmalate dehydratase small subunit|nr:3-isopropylmalate dehydratase [Phycisphaerales bacterium]MBT7171411.1 3-isopropylmalate dehydratase [Phycisphaerales bacterium]
METKLTGRVFVLGDDIDTDQIIPAEFLSYNPSVPEERKQFGRYALCGVPEGQTGLPQGDIPFTAEGKYQSEFSLIVAGKNFGCGSSREHAPLAIAEAGCQFIVAESYARIFYRNCINGGYCAPLVTPETIRAEFSTGDEVTLDIEVNTLVNTTTGKSFAIDSLGDAGEIISSGGIFKYARTHQTD